MREEAERMRERKKEREEHMSSCSKFPNLVTIRLCMLSRKLSGTTIYCFNCPTTEKGKLQIGLKVVTVQNYIGARA